MIPFLDEYGVSLSVLFIVMMEMIAVCWFYGVERFSKNIRLMLGKTKARMQSAEFRVLPGFVLEVRLVLLPRLYWGRLEFDKIPIEYKRGIHPV